MSATISQAAADVLAERERQVAIEGWTPEHDDEHWGGEMAVAAACYAARSVRYYNRAVDLEAPPEAWPWDAQWWKPKSDRADLVKAGALIIAEIERLDRQEPRP